MRLFPVLVFCWVILVMIFAPIGWVLNIVQVIPHLHDPLTTMVLLKLIGIIALPLGAVLGWVGCF